MFYTYAYLREDGTPYYIGKGRDRRAYQKHGCHNPPTKNRIEILDYFEKEQDAFDEEVRLIKHYGRKDLGTGILRNLTAGGDGNAQYDTLEEALESKKEVQRRAQQKKINKDREEHNRKRREYEKNNKEKIRAKRREYYYKNRDKELQRKKDAYWNSKLNNTTA